MGSSQVVLNVQAREDPRIAWLRDGRLLYQVSEPPPRGNEDNLWAIPVDTRTGRPSGSAQRVTDLPGVYSFLFTASADGKRLAAKIDKRQRDVHVAELIAGDITSESVRRLTLDDREDWQAEWAPDASAVYFASNRTGNWDIYRQRKS